MKRRVLILEDLEISRKALVKLVSECEEELIIYDFEDPASALECAMENDIDLFLVDIVLKPNEPNDFSGITFARNIRENARYAAAEIIFITSLAGLEAQMLRSVHCFDYIEKPISEERVFRVLKAVFRKLDGRQVEDELVFLRKDRVTYPICADRIIYVESRGKVLYIGTVDEVIDIPNLSLKKFVERVKTQNFLYPIKGFAINVKYIEFVDSTNRYVKMRGVEQMIDIGTRMKEKFMKELYKYEGVDRR